MIPNFDLDTLNRQLEAWYTLVHSVDQRSLADEPRRILQESLAQVRRGQAMVNSEYPKEVEAARRSIEAIQARNAETLAKAESVQGELARLAAAPPVSPAMSVPAPVDAKLGYTLRDELLARYAIPSDDRIDLENIGSVASHWEESHVPEQPAPKVAPAPKSPPPAEARPGKKTKRISDKDADAWDDLSKLDE